MSLFEGQTLAVLSSFCACKNHWKYFGVGARSNFLDCSGSRLWYIKIISLLVFSLYLAHFRFYFAIIRGKYEKSNLERVIWNNLRQEGWYFSPGVIVENKLYARNYIRFLRHLLYYIFKHSDISFYHWFMWIN